MRRRGRRLLGCSELGSLLWSSVTCRLLPRSGIMRGLLLSRVIHQGLGMSLRLLVPRMVSPRGGLCCLLVRGGGDDNGWLLSRGVLAGW
jgi:hypothetical protein